LALYEITHNKLVQWLLQAVLHQMRLKSTNFQKCPLRGISPSLYRKQRQEGCPIVKPPSEVKQKFSGQAQCYYSFKCEVGGASHTPCLPPIWYSS
jgi:hypothetical protein